MFRSGMTSSQVKKSKCLSECLYQHVVVPQSAGVPLLFREGRADFLAFAFELDSYGGWGGEGRDVPILG